MTMVSYYYGKIVRATRKAPFGPKTAHDCRLCGGERTRSILFTPSDPIPLELYRRMWLHCAADEKRPEYILWICDACCTELHETWGVEIVE